MRFPPVLILGFVFFVAGCAEKEQVSSEPADETATTAAGVDAATAVDEIWRNGSFIDHMHLHAEKLDDLNFALADDDLEAAKAAAEWLATHDTESSMQSDWMPHLYRMRAEAQSVVEASDIAAAQAAALRLTIQCQECHAAVGINAGLLDGDTP